MMIAAAVAAAAVKVAETAETAVGCVEDSTTNQKRTQIVVEAKQIKGRFQ